MAAMSYTLSTRHYLFLKAHSFQFARALLLGNCSLLGTNNARQLTNILASSHQMEAFVIIILQILMELRYDHRSCNCNFKQLQMLAGKNFLGLP